MKKWSKYNVSFVSDRFGHFLYNTLTNVLFELDRAHHEQLEQLRTHPRSTPTRIDEDFLALLEEGGVLSEDHEEERELMIKRYERNTISFDTSHLGLSICPTLACNFRCSYCYEPRNEQAVTMTLETMDKIVDFDVEFDNAGLITNGYLLEEEKIERLDSLGINHVQISIDGDASIHDRRRVLADGRPTFDKIMANIDALMSSSYEGSCCIRVNVDKDNMDGYAVLRSQLLERYQGTKLFVHAGRVENAALPGQEHGCSMCTDDWADFTTALYYEDHIVPRDRFYPSNQAINICAANSRSCYVIGPEGELYKCYKDVGKDEMSIGNLHSAEVLTRPELVAMYSIGTDPFDDDTCKECTVLPICGGGCANLRLRSRYFGEQGLQFCHHYKENLADYLEAYYDVFRTQEICRTVFENGRNLSTERGYRMVQPREETDTLPWSRG